MKGLFGVTVNTTWLARQVRGLKVEGYLLYLYYHTNVGNQIHLTGI